MISRRKFSAGAAALLASSRLIRPASASIYRSGNRIFYLTPLYWLDTITPEAGVKLADLVPNGGTPNGTYPQRVNLSNFRGMMLIPPEAFNIKVGAQLFRDYSGLVGQTDATMGLQVWTPAGGTEYPDSFATAACTPVGSGSQCTSPGAIVESLGRDPEFPNIINADGSHAVFGWSIGGNTVLKCAAMGQLKSFDVPSDYVLPSVWPARNVATSTLAMYFGSDGFADSSPSTRTVTANNVSIEAGSTTKWANPQSPPDALLYTDTGGGAAFNGSSSYLQFNGSDITLSGDFTLQATISANSNAVQGGCQQRVASLGDAGSPAIAIDPVGGGAMLISEASSALHIGGNSVISGYPTLIEWIRKSGVNILRINGQQDGQPFNDTTSWVLSSTAEIGRYHQGTVGYFTGKIHFLKIENGLAI